VCGGGADLVGRRDGAQPAVRATRRRGHGRRHGRARRRARARARARHAAVTADAVAGRRRRAAPRARARRGAAADSYLALRRAEWAGRARGMQQGTGLRCLPCRGQAVPARMWAWAQQPLLCRPPGMTSLQTPPGMTSLQTPLQNLAPSCQSCAAASLCMALNRASGG